MEWVTLTQDNIDKEHICCALSSKDEQVISKKEWLKEQLNHGLVFTKLNERGKCFIEYMPLESAWISLTGDHFMYINCLWVSGRFQGLGYAKVLLEGCIKESLKQGKKGIVILSSQKKKAFTMDYDFLIKQGFISVDHWNDYELMFLPLCDDVIMPKFNITKCQEEGFVLYYTYQCPFNIKYVQQLIEYCHQQNIPMKVKHIQTREDALKAPTPLTTYSLFYNQKFITREVLTSQKFEKIRRELCQK